MTGAVREHNQARRARRFDATTPAAALGPPGGGGARSRATGCKRRRRQRSRSRSIEGCVHQNHLISVRPRSGLVTSDYLLAFINSEPGRSYFHSSGNTTSGLVTISTSIVKNCRIPVPPLPLQNEFANQVAYIHKLQAKQATSRRRMNDLFESMLHNAFAGDL